MRSIRLCSSLITTLLCVASLAAGLAAADQWPRFRGPDAGVVPDDPSLPDTWSETQNVAWKTPIPGMGWSSPVVWDDHVFVTAAISTGQEKPPIPGLYDPGDEQGSLKSTAEHRWVVYDVDFKTGRVRWQRELFRSPPPLARHIKNTDASETPVTDGERVYVYLGALGMVVALDMNGKTLWSKEVGAYAGTSQFGSGASPALHGDRLYLVNDNATGSYIMALDTRTGREVWKVVREDAPQGWATPFVWQHDLRTEIITTTSDGQGTKGSVRSYSLDGKLLWQLKGLTILATPTPFARHGLVYISSGYPGASPRPVYAVRAGASGDISLKGDETSNQFVAWYQPLLGTYNTTALAYGDYYYTLLDRGFLLCHDARTGRQIYGRQRISAESSGFTASPWAYNGKIFALGEDGDTFVIEAGPTYKLLGKNSLNEMAMATPAIVRGSLIIRTQFHLYRIQKDARP